MCFLLFHSDAHTVERIKALCAEIVAQSVAARTASGAGSSLTSTHLETAFFSAKPAQAVYNLEVIYSLLMPAWNQNSEETFDFQVRYENDFQVRYEKFNRERIFTVFQYL